MSFSRTQLCSGVARRTSLRATPLRRGERRAAFSQYTLFSFPTMKDVHNMFVLR